METCFRTKIKTKNTVDKSLVVYKINCKLFGAAFIGKTEKILCHRIKEDINNSKYTFQQHKEANPDQEIDNNGIEIIEIIIIKLANISSYT